MRFAVSVSVEGRSDRAVEEVCREAASRMDAEPADFALLFVSPHHAESYETILRGIREKLRPRVLLGCTAAGVIGADREIEDRAGLALWLARLPGAVVRPFHLRFDPEAEEIRGWPEPMPLASEKPSFLLLPDPFTIPAEAALGRLNGEFSEAAIFGGMASGASAPGQNRLFWNTQILEEGAVGAAFTGRLRVRTVVSQGCRPIGKHFVVTQAEGNVIRSLGGKPALQQIQELFETLPPLDQGLFRRGLHVGKVVNELQPHFRRGDFLVRNVMGVDQESGAIAVGDYVRKGQTVQFHVRDAESAREDLRQMLEREKRDASTNPERTGALLFSCNGRGSHLFGKPNHDVGAVQEVLGPLPVAGFFAAGEIGPIGGRAFLHGFTASLAIFSEPGPS